MLKLNLVLFCFNFLAPHQTLAHEHLSQHLKTSASTINLSMVALALLVLSTLATRVDSNMADHLTICGNDLPRAIAMLCNMAIEGVLVLVLAAREGFACIVTTYQRVGL